ncbi:MAG TPA: ABC transporter substrate-binding protein [Mycobacteriales bacterium]|nr:ABC transporter substrate-binding protein [Mycobacteriales bacterium]
MHPPEASPYGPNPATLSRRDLLRLGIAAGVGAPLLTACGGFGDTGGGGDKLVFLSTQFAPVEEAERFRGILKSAYTAGSVDYVTSDPGPYNSKVRSEVRAGKVGTNLIGGVHGDLAPLARDGQLEDLGGLAQKLAGRGYAKDLLELAKVGTNTTYYIPWAQATFILAASNTALQYLPPGATIDNLTYDQFLAWAKAAKQAAGKPVFGVPAGPKGLIHRFLQGYLYPAFTGGEITKFRSPEAVTMWGYLKELWSVCTPASANFDFMQEPLAAKQVLVAWDHVARLVNAPKDAPDQFVMAPVPSGPKGRAYMPVLTGLAIPKGAPARDKTEQLIEALSTPDVQLDVLRKNAFFPTVQATIPSDLPAAVRLEADAVRKQQTGSGALIALPPVGLGTGEGELTKIYKDTFARIVLKNEAIAKVLADEGDRVQKLLADSKAPCWTPDPDSGGQTCQVG